MNTCGYHCFGESIVVLVMSVSQCEEAFYLDSTSLYTCMSKFDLGIDGKSPLVDPIFISLLLLQLQI